MRGQERWRKEAMNKEAALDRSEKNSGTSTEQSSTSDESEISV